MDGALLRQPRTRGGRGILQTPGHYGPHFHRNRSGGICAAAVSAVPRSLAMEQDNKTRIDGRDLLRVLGAAAVAAAIPGALVGQVQADSRTTDEKRKARYDANSDDVKAF